MSNNERVALGDNSSRALTPADHDKANREMGHRFVRALSVEKAALDHRIGIAEIKTLAAITYCMSDDDQRAFPSYITLSDLTGYSEWSIEQAIRRLREFGYIFTERRQTERGGRALVHYGLTALRLEDRDEVLGAAIKALRMVIEEKAARTGKPARPPSALALRLLTQGNIQGSLGGDPVKYPGVRVTDPVENPGVSPKADPMKKPGVKGVTTGNTPGSEGLTPGNRQDSNTSSSNRYEDRKAVVEQASTLLPGSPMAIEEVDLPAPLPDLIDTGTSKVGSAGLISSIKAAIARKVPAGIIEADLRKAVTWAAQKAFEKGGREPSPSEVFRACTVFVERSSKDQPAPVSWSDRHMGDLNPATGELPSIRTTPED